MEDNSIDTKKQVLPVSFTVYESTGPLSKSYSLDADGTITKTPAAQMVTGKATRRRLDFAEFGHALALADSKTAFGFGLHDTAFPDTVRIALKGRENEAAGILSRSKQYFAYRPIPSVLMNDFDPDPSGPKVTPDELRAILAGIIPGFAGAACWVRGSSSAGVHVAGKPPQASKGYHIYNAVLDGTDIPRFGAVLFKRLWLAGHGFIAISGAGTCLTRTLLDASVYMGERLDFVGRPVIEGEGLEWAAPEAHYSAGDYLDTTRLLDLTTEEETRFQELVSEAKATREPERAAARAAWAGEQVGRMIARGTPPKEARAAAKRLEAGGASFHLPPEFILDWADGTSSTVAEVLKNAPAYNEKPLADPFEGKNYGATTAKFYANTGSGMPLIHSHAHGGQKFTLGDTKKPKAKAATRTKQNSADPGKPSFYSFDDNGKPKLLRHKKAAEVLVPLVNDLLYDGTGGTWLRRQNNIWHPIPGQEAEAAISDTVSRVDPTLDCDVAWLRGTMAFLALSLIWRGERTPKRAIPFQNGVLCLDDMSFEPYRAEDFFTWQLPFDYSPTATCEPVQAWLFESVRDGMQVELLRAYLNAILTGRSDLQRYLELIGPGGSGKGTFLRLAGDIVGKSNFHATELKRLENNRFETAKLYGKRLCIISDAEKYNGGVTVLKALTGSDSIPFEEKHKQSGAHFRFGGMILIAANQDICSSDYTSGLQRRRITVRFKNVVSEDAKRDLEEEFEPYLPGVINWALSMPSERVVQLVRNTGEHVKTLNGVTAQTLMETNPIAAWAHENLVYAPGLETYVGRRKIDERSRTIMDADKYLYPNFCQWADETGHRPMAANTFVMTLNDLVKYQLKLPGAKHDRNRNGGHFIGIGIRPEYPANAELTPIEARFGAINAETNVTDCDGPVTGHVTHLSRSVTNVTHFTPIITKNSYETSYGGHEKESAGGKKHENFLESRIRSVTSVTSVTEPLKCVTSPSQVSKVCHTDPKNDTRQEALDNDGLDDDDLEDDGGEDF